MNFRGRSLRNLDPKGRLMLSPEYRESLYLRMQQSTNTSNEPTKEPTCELPNEPTNELMSEATQDSNCNPTLELTHKEQKNLGKKPIPTANSEGIVLVGKENIQEIKLVITTYDNCLAAFSWNDWLKLEEQFSRLPNPSSKVRSFRRLFIGGAEEQIIDPQGRVRISSDHKEYAKLEKEVSILGLITRFEIWNPKLLRASIEAQSLDDVTEELSASGIDFAL